MFEPLTDSEKEAFRSLLTAVHEEAHARDESRPARETVALMRVRHEDRDRAAIVVMRGMEDGSVFVRPVALLIDDDLFAAIAPGDGTEGMETVNS